MSILKTIRIFIVRQFALNYLSKILGFIGPYTSTLRCTRIIYPLVVITGFVHVTNPNWPTPTFLGWILLTLLTICLYIGFPWFGVGYFSIWPVQWNELDDFQKYQYGGVKQESLTPEQFKEWLLILEKLKEKYPELY